MIGREVAIKILHAKYSTDPVAIARFVSEARAVNQIAHPGTVEIYDFGDHAGRQFLVMELLAGQTLRALLEQRGRLPLAEALPILRAVTEAVDAAHAVGIAHRDLKPDNVFVGEITKLIDFGIAKLGGESATLTETGSMLGTPQYMSPEQCRGRASDTRTDQYSFGALAYHVLVGEPPFGGDPIEVALHHLNDRPIAPSKRRRELTQRIDRALFALLAKDPAMRPATCSEAVEALAGARLRTRWSRRTKLAIAAVPLVAGGVVAAIALRGGDAPAAASECPSSADKLYSIWGPAMAKTIAARFSQGDDDAKTVGRDAVKNLDAFAADWGERWDAAGTAPDRASDRLLYGQRLTCLENALLDMRATVEALTVLPVPMLADGGFDAGQVGLSQGRLLEDCGNERVLRAQVPAPPVAARDRLTELARDANRFRIEATIAITRRDTPGVDRALDKLAAKAQEIAAIDKPSAAMWIATRGWMLGMYAFDTDMRRRPAARMALRDAIRQVEASGDTVALAMAYLALADLE